MAAQGKPLPFSTRQQIKELRSVGTPVREVAKALGVNRNTACKYGRTTLGQTASHGTSNR